MIDLLKNLFIIKLKEVIVMKNKTVKIVIAVIVAVILLFIAFAVGYFFGTIDEFLNQHINDENYITAENSEIKITEEVKNIEVEWVSGNVTVTRSEDAYLYVIEEGRISESDALVYKLNGNTLEIDFAKPSFGFFGINSSPSKDLTLKLPEKYYDNININSVSADVDISNVSSYEIDLESVSGKIEMRQTSFKDLDVEMVSGNTDIYLPHSASFRAEIDSVSGDFNTDFAVTKQGDAYICGNGDLDVSADMVSGDLGIYKQ